MTETKKTRTRSAKSAPKADLIELAAAPVAEVPETLEVAQPAPAAPKPSASAEAQLKKSNPFIFALGDQGEVLRQAVRESAAVSATGALEVNDKIIQALQSQGQAAIDLWRTALDNSRRPDGLNAQTGAARQAFETTSAQWTDIAETTARWMAKSVEPFQSALLRHSR